jgi:hypothetical protein
MHSIQQWPHRWPPPLSNWTILVPLFQTASALDPPIIVEYLSTSRTSADEDVETDDMGRLSFPLALFVLLQTF